MSLPQPDGYLAMPDAGSDSAVLVLHAWWGLNDTMKEVCNRLAESGFACFAPDLYLLRARPRPGVQPGSSDPRLGSNARVPAAFMMPVSAVAWRRVPMS